MAYSTDKCTGGTATATDATNGAAANAFDNTLGTYWGPSGTTGIIRYNFGTGITHCIRRYRVYGAEGYTYMPKDWTFQGSNDGTNFTTLDTQTSQSWASAAWKTYDITNTTAYRYYQLNISANNGGAFIALFEIEMMTILPLGGFFLFM